MKAFQSFLLESLDTLDRIAELEDPVERHSLACGDIAAKAGDMAARLGLSDLHERSTRFGAFADVQPVKTFISACLSQCQPESATTPYLDATEAAAYLRITLSSLYGLVDRRRIIPLRGPKRSYRFTQQILDDYLGLHC